MCVLALRVPDSPGGTLLVAANRDESRARSSAPPQVLDERGSIGGKDLVSGGTWLGVAPHGLVVAVTNRSEPRRGPASRSRGLLVLEALRQPSVAVIERHVARAVSEQHHGGFNLVAILGRDAACLHWDGALRTTRFGPGWHVVSTSHDLDDDAMPEARAFAAWRARHAPEPDDAALVELLASHEGSRPICKHDGDDFGTVSSTILRLGPAGRTWLHAAGPPCRTAFTDVSPLLDAPRRAGGAGA